MSTGNSRPVIEDATFVFGQLWSRFSVYGQWALLGDLNLENFKHYEGILSFVFHNTLKALNVWHLWWKVVLADQVGRESMHIPREAVNHFKSVRFTCTTPSSPPLIFPPFIYSAGYRWFNSLCGRAEDQQRARMIMIDYMTQTFPVWSLFVRVFEPFYSVACLWPAAGLAKTLSFLLLLHRPNLPLASLCCKPLFLQQIILWWEFESAVDWLAVVVQFKTKKTHTKKTVYWAGWGVSCEVWWGVGPGIPP